MGERRALGLVAMAMVSMVGCRMSAPQGYLGVKWGDETAASVARLKATCDSWLAWEGGGGFTACFDIDHTVEALGAPAFVRLFQKDGKIAALSLRFRGCGARRAELTAAVRKEFRLEAGDGDPYQVFADQSLVHLSHDGGDDSCTLTVSGPEFGKAFAAYLLQGGLRGMARGLRPSH